MTSDGEGPEEATDADDDKSAGETYLCFPSHDSRSGRVGDKTTRKDTGLHPVGQGGAAKSNMCPREIKGSGRVQIGASWPRTSVSPVVHHNISTEPLTLQD